jgi:hypothetical protein
VEIRSSKLVVGGEGRTFEQDTLFGQNKRTFQTSDTIPRKRESGGS